MDQIPAFFLCDLFIGGRSMMYKFLSAIVIFILINHFSSLKAQAPPCQGKVIILEIDEVIVDEPLLEEIAQLDSLTISQNKVHNERKKQILDTIEGKKNFTNKIRTHQPEGITNSLGKIFFEFETKNYCSKIPGMAFTQITFALERSLGCDDYIVYPINLKTPKTLNSLKAICEQEEAEFILGFPRLALFMYDLKYAKLNMIIYSKSQNQIIYDKIWTENEEGEWRRYGCEVGTVDCAINSILYQAAFSDMIDLFATY